MNPTASRQKSIGIAVILILLALPLIFLAVSRPAIRSLLPFNTPKERAPQKGDRFTVVNNDPDFTISLVDTSYLDYISAKLKLFDDKAVIEPAYYAGNRTATGRHTVTNVRFELVPILQVPPVAKLYEANTNTGKPTSPWGYMGYALERTTLVIQMALDTQMVTKGIVAPKFNINDKFTTLAVYYRLKPPSPAALYSWRCWRLC